MGSARDWIFNHLRVVFHVADVQDIPAEHYEAARALVRSKREAARSFSEFFAEKRDWFNREVLGGCAPWTPAIKSKLTKALNQKVSLPLRVIWGSTESPHGMKWDKDKPETVRHLCPHCRGAITQADYLAVWERGQWVSRCGNFTYDHVGKRWIDDVGMPCRPPRHVAFVGVWTAYSPQRAWPDIVREFLEARKAQKAGDSGPMQGFRNETLADVWEEEYEHTDVEVLHRRALQEPDIPLQVVPIGACKVLLGTSACFSIIS